MHASFHFPLHRYLAAFISQAVRVMGVPLVEVLPDQEMLSLLMMHPLRVQVRFYFLLYLLFNNTTTFYKKMFWCYLLVT